MKLLMHICCANCCLYPIQTLNTKGIDVKGFWINPNIHPYTEYQMRLDSVLKLQKDWSLDIEYTDHYGLREFLRTVVNNEENRCVFCYSMRLEETAKAAKKMRLDGFTTSLLVSPYQKFDKIIEDRQGNGKTIFHTFLYGGFQARLEEEHAAIKGARSLQTEVLWMHLLGNGKIPEKSRQQKVVVAVDCRQET